MISRAALPPWAFRPTARGRPLPRFARRRTRDPHLLLAIGLVVPIVAVQVVASSDESRLVAGLAVAFLAAQLGFRHLRPFTRPRTLDLARLGLAMLFVMIASRLGQAGSSSPLLWLSIPIVAMAAALGTREVLLIGAFSVVGYVLSVAVNPDSMPLARERAIALTATATLLAISIRRTIASLERAVARLRSTVAADRRRGRQILGVEAVGQLLATAGPTAAALDGVLGLLVDRFGYDHVSIYLGDATRMRLGAQHGYQEPTQEFAPTASVIGRVMRTGQAALVPDVASDPDYTPGAIGVLSLVSVPLISGIEVIGVLNVETCMPERLDEDDLAAVRLVADRLASALALSRERDRLSRRVARFEQLTAFAQQLNTPLDVQELYEVLAALLPTVVPCDFVSVAIRDEARGDYRIVAIPGVDEKLVGKRIQPGEGISGRAIAEGRLVVDSLGRDGFPHAVRHAPVADTLNIAAVPLIRDGTVIGVMAVVRNAPGDPFDDLEQEILPLIAGQAGLAITNARLHEAATEASIRDTLTGLYNRRHLDASLARLAAVRARSRPEDRRSLAIIMFDLDHFGLFNKRYGHLVGDEVLRTFGRILQDRFRRSDILARFGGEEFVAVLEGGTLSDAVAVAEDVRTRLRETPVEGPNGELLTATVSAGCASLEPATELLDGLLETADVGLAMAKQAGRDQVVAAVSPVRQRARCRARGRVNLRQKGVNRRPRVLSADA